MEFRPWSLELTLRDLRIAKSQTAGAGQAEPAPSSPQLQVDRIYVNASIQSLFRLAPVLDAIEVDAPVLRLTQQSLGHFDVDDVLARLAEPSDTPPAKPLGFALYNIALRDGRVQLQDDVQQREHMLDQLQLKLPFISNLESSARSRCCRTCPSHSTAAALNPVPRARLSPTSARRPSI